LIRLTPAQFIADHFGDPTPLFFQGLFFFPTSRLLLGAFFPLLTSLSGAVPRNSEFLMDYGKSLLHTMSPFSPNPPPLKPCLSFRFSVCYSADLFKLSGYLDSMSSIGSPPYVFPSFPLIFAPLQGTLFLLPLVVSKGRPAISSRLQFFFQRQLSSLFDLSRALYSPFSPLGVASRLQSKNGIEFFGYFTTTPLQPFFDPSSVRPQLSVGRHLTLCLRFLSPFITRFSFNPFPLPLPSV